MSEEHARYETKNRGSVAKQLQQSPALRPFADDGYQAPSPEEISAAIEYANLSSAEAGALLGADSRTIRRWKSGDREMPYAAWRLLLIDAGLVKPAGEGDRPAHKTSKDKRTLVVTSSDIAKNEARKKNAN